MGHRDIWGKNPAKWKKQCPCFDAEKEYAFLDDMKLDKYADAGCDDTSESALIDTTKGKLIDYILDYPRDYTGFMEKMMPFGNEKVGWF